MVTLGFRNPDTGKESLVEIGSRDDTDSGYWAIEIDPDTREGIGGCFIALDCDLF